MNILFMLLLLVLASFLIVLILVQRGKGGGLAGALGGMGGQSAFGTKAGDLFTRITVGVAFVWIVVCVASVLLLRGSSQLRLDITPPANSAPAAPGGQTAKTTPSSTPAEKPASTPAPAEKPAEQPAANK